jgi:23S rRNA pseudouridine1911/1915/1917 synthase
MSLLVQKETTLLKALIALYPESSRRTLQNWIEKKRIQVDNQIVKKPHFIVKRGQKINLLKKDLCPLPVVYKDHFLIVIDKPCGLLSVPKDDSVERNALDVLKRHFADENIYAVHRLDQKTSGLMVFSRGKASTKTLCQAFKKHEVQRVYYAVCEGALEKEEGLIESYLKEGKNLSMVSSQNPDAGKKAITEYKVLQKKAFSTHLLLTLQTGKKHQIRVHLKDIGHPILADKRYGCMHDPIGRLCLHATTLKLKHPDTNKEMVFTSPAPNNFKRI